jgi:hypothetical protein
MGKIGKFTQILMIRPRQVLLLAQRFSQKRTFNCNFYTNKLKIFYSRVLKDVSILKKCTGRCILHRLERYFWKFKKNAFFPSLKRLGMTTIGMPGKQVGNLSTLTKNSGSFLLEFPFSRRRAKI